jgi:hypothetical protein
VGGVPARQISTPLLGQIQLAVDESMSEGAHVGKKNADLAIFHAPCQSAILRSNASGVTATFGQATFIDDEHREERLV